MDNTSFKLSSAKDAKTRFGEVLDEALGRPVGITRHERLTAYVVSKRDFENLCNRVHELEDQLLLIQAEAARNEGRASDDEVAAFLRTARDRCSEPGDNAAGAKSRSNA